MYINFQQIRVSRSVKTVHAYICKVESYINLQLPIVTFKKSFISDMHHRINCMSINFNQIRVSRSVKTVHQYIVAKNNILHKFATIRGTFLSYSGRKIQKRVFQHIHSNQL